MTSILPYDQFLALLTSDDWEISEHRKYIKYIPSDSGDNLGIFLGNAT